MPGKLYEVLELSKKNVVTKADIKSQYRILAKNTHPDRNKAPDANYQFQCLNVAYIILKDESTRKDYDADSEALDKEIFNEGVSATIPKRFQKQENSSHSSGLNSVSNKYSYSKIDPIKIDIKLHSFDGLLNKLLADYGKIHQGSFIFSNSNLAYVRKFNSIISSVVNEFGATQELLAQRYTALWLITIMNEGNQIYRYDKNLGGDTDTLRNIFQRIKVKTALSDAAKLIKKNEFLSRLLLLQHINYLTVNDVLEQSTKKQTEKALKFGIGQLYYYKESINAVMNVDWKGAGYYYYVSLLISKNAFKRFVPAYIIFTLGFSTLILFFGTPVVPMTTIGLIAGSLIGTTLFFGPVLALTLLGASIAMFVFAKKFGNAMQQKKLKIKTTIKETTDKKLENIDRYSFFHKSICSIATKSEVDITSENFAETKRLTHEAL